MARARRTLGLPRRSKMTWNVEQSDQARTPRRSRLWHLGRGDCCKTTLFNFVVTTSIDKAVAMK
jgi:hypothetical protein